MIVCWYLFLSLVDCCCRCKECGFDLLGVSIETVSKRPCVFPNVQDAVQPKYPLCTPAILRERRSSAKGESRSRLVRSRGPDFFHDESVGLEYAIIDLEEGD